MKKLVKLFVCLSLIICTVFIITNSKVNKNVPVDAASNLVEVTDDKGNVVYHRNSSEPVMRLKEYNYPTQNLRACWVSNFVGSLPSYSNEEKWKADYTYVLDKMETYGLNCIIFHVRTHNNALYKSELNPVASWFANVNFDEFDPLAWAIEETHKRGIEFHAWLNPYRISTNGGSTQFVSGSIPAVNPVNDSSKLLQSGDSIILNPGLQSNRDFIVDSCMEVVENYDVDAIHRNEGAASLHGLLRVRVFHQDDSHNFIRQDQIFDEITSILEIANYFYDIFGLKFTPYLSTRPDDYMGDLEKWNEAEEKLTEVLNNAFGKDGWVLNPGDGAFYGPKLDFKLRDSMNRIWQCGTIQLDMNLPERFDLTYIAEDGTKKRPIMIHRALFGSLERFIGILIEHYGGAFPTWLAPVQVKIIPVNNEFHLDYEKQVFKKLEYLGIRC